MVDGLIIPRAWNEYINKSDPVAMSEALQQSGVMDAAPTAGSNKPAKSGGIFSANAVIMASGTTLTGVTIASGSIIRVMFTAAVSGTDTTTGLSLTYNGTAYAVKVGKNGALADFVAAAISESYVYLQAYTTLELAFDGTQFIIIGNPVVISSADYTIYADGHTGVNLVVKNTIYTEVTDLSSQGWYRLATSIIYVYGAIYEIELLSGYNYNPPCSKKIIITLGWQGCNIQILGNKDEDSVITKIRTVQFGDGIARALYIDIYYNKTSVNTICAYLTCKHNGITLNNFTPITDIPTGSITEQNI